ncbi:DegT/DnrJ/EryC1/StrS family aminotransferase [Maribacter sp. R77961]|uniref:DegT/DnrJ/EryC1/StrS family aminotransferase n=1 Tax=Maribacter sp. R77961 TaxID=3093871 RepID=UPI0037C9FCF7
MENLRDKVQVTQTFMPPKAEYDAQLERIWESKWLTNRGVLTKELELKLKNYLNVHDILIMNNGTIPLQIALKLVGGEGEIITTPFSYVATTAAIIWENCTPVFVDIDPDYLTIDESQIEASITEKTTAILATHVFGNPCNIEVIDKIAKKHNLKVIYDAAHCFGVTYNEESIFKSGDISTCSFHATKLFHTGEGGAIFCEDKELMHKISYSHNFGHNGPIDFHGLGINAKISELQSAMGLSVLPYMDKIILERKKVVNYYLKNLSFETLKTIKIRKNVTWNYSYFPIIFKNEETLFKVQKALNDENVFPRRYFYPSLNTISYTNKSNMPVSESIAKRILCLPLFVGMSTSLLQRICDQINKNLV